MDISCTSSSCSYVENTVTEVVIEDTENQVLKGKVERLTKKAVDYIMSDYGYFCLQRK